jgi:hypothetical protein
LALWLMRFGPCVLTHANARVWGRRTRGGRVRWT